MDDVPQLLCGSQACPPQTAWQAPPLNRGQRPGQPQASLLKLGGSGKDTLQSLLRAHDQCLGLPGSGSHSWQKHTLVASSAAFLNMVPRSVLPESLRKPWVPATWY